MGRTHMLADWFHRKTETPLHFWSANNLVVLI
jgi:hypothetical protein